MALYILDHSASLVWRYELACRDEVVDADLAVSYTGVWLWLAETQASRYMVGRPVFVHCRAVS